MSSVVTTPATKLPPQEVDLSHRLQCYRLILDEAHLYERGYDPKLPTTRMFKSGMDHYCPDVVTPSLTRARGRGRALTLTLTLSRSGA